MLLRLEDVLDDADSGILGGLLARPADGRHALRREGHARTCNGQGECSSWTELAIRGQDRFLIERI